MTLPLLLCDLDDTLVDRDEAFRRWPESFARKHSLPLEDTVAWLAEMDDRGCRSRTELVASIAQRFGVWSDRALALAQYRHDLAFRVPEISRGCRVALSQLRQAGWRIAIVTNGITSPQQSKVGVSGLAPLVDACVISESAGCCKPDAAIFQQAADACGASFESGWMIGDNPDRDIVGAPLSA